MKVGMGDFAYYKVGSVVERAAIRSIMPAIG